VGWERSVRQGVKKEKMRKKSPKPALGSSPSADTKIKGAPENRATLGPKGHSAARKESRHAAKSRRGVLNGSLGKNFLGEGKKKKGERGVKKRSIHSIPS